MRSQLCWIMSEGMSFIRRNQKWMSNKLHRNMWKKVRSDFPNDTVEAPMQYQLSTVVPFCLFRMISNAIYFWCSKRTYRVRNKLLYLWNFDVENRFEKIKRFFLLFKYHELCARFIKSIAFNVCDILKLSRFINPSKIYLCIGFISRSRFIILSPL